MVRPDLSIVQILGWVDVFHKRTGRWPNSHSGRIPGTDGERWAAVDKALRQGKRGLPGPSSLTLFLLKHRGVLPPYLRPRLSLQKILAWADAFHQRTRSWPMSTSGPIPEAGNDTWDAVDTALRTGRRGLVGGSSLIRLLAKHRGVRNTQALPPLTEAKILALADAYHRRTGQWPTRNSGPIPEAQGETWLGLSTALHMGLRGLPGGSSLARLLAKERGVRNRKNLPKYKIKKILRWAAAYKKRVGKRPTHIAGPIPEAPGETWGAVEAALKSGQRGLPGGSSLYQLLAKHGLS